MEKVRVGIIGLGNRGPGMMKGFLKNPDVIVTAVCDVYKDRCDAAAKTVKEIAGNEPFATLDYKEIFKGGYCDCVYVASAWEYHVEIACAAMRAGVIPGIEVGGAYDISECYELVDTHEKTGTEFMFMENCCYGREELVVTAMARAGKFGEIVHCQGAYAHDLRYEISHGNVNRHYRLRNYLNRNCDNYPTHALGPIAKLLDINRGNRMVSLVSVASKARGMEQYIKDNPQIDPSLAGKRFNQGDVVTTIITCAGGETIVLRLDTTLPRFYTRDFTVRGTKGLYEQTPNLVFLDGDKEEWDSTKVYREGINNLKNYEDEFLPDIWRNITEEQKKSGHGGIDTFVVDEFVKAVKEGTEMPIDVYDAAVWMSITALSAKSIEEGGAPQEIPDFTRGKWLLRQPKDVVKLG